MRRQKIGLYPGIALTAAFLLCWGFVQENAEIKDIIDKNIEAVGGKAKISGIESYSFQIGTQTVYLSKNGKMKLTSGKDPVITEVILVSSKGARRNCFNEASEFEGIERSVYLTLARLRSALFTLSNYNGQLEYEGQKKFGPRSLHKLTAEEGELTVEFYIDSEDHLLKRLVFSGYSSESGQFEVNYDFVSYQEVDGLKIPESWFASQVGTRGNLQSAENVRFNLVLDENFFDNDEVNVGEVEIGEGNLKGRVVDFNMMRGNRLMISTNWTETCMDRAGFQNEDKLIVDVAGRKIETVLYREAPPREAYSNGVNLLMPDTRMGNYVIYFLSPEQSDLLEQLEPLMPISTIKKQSQ